MKIAIKLAYRNLIGAGLRTWLNVIVLSFSFVVIIFMKGILVGWDHQAKTDMTNWEIGNGQYWNNKYDPFDPFTLSESHGQIPDQAMDEISKGMMVPVLITQGSIYPEGRMQSVVLKGIPMHQSLLSIPSSKLDTAISEIPAIIGSSMARANKLKKGDVFTIQWRDAHSTFDATEVKIVEVFSTNVPSVDAGQVWISLSRLQSMMGVKNHATTLTFKEKTLANMEFEGWKFKPKSELTADIDELIKTKSVGQSIFYIILLLLAMLAIFDTQVLTIFRRQKEIGTYVALGYTKREVVGLFTVEGAMNSVLAAIVSAIYGIPFLYWMAVTGYELPVDADSYGMSIAQTMYPMYSAGLVISTVVIIMLTTTIVSYWPSRKISKMNPTEALRGKIQ